MGELKGPAYYEIKQLISSKSLIEFYTINGSSIKGQLMWFDNNVFHVLTEDSKEISILNSAVIYYSKISNE